MHLESLTRPELIFPRLPAKSRDAVLHLMARKLAEQEIIQSSDELVDRLLEREELGSTGIGSGVAIPHCKSAEISKPLLAVALPKKEVEFGALDGKPVRLVFLVVSPADSPAAHLQVLAAISRWVKQPGHVEEISRLRDPDAIYDMLRTDI